MRKSLPSIALVPFVLGLVATPQTDAQVKLRAVGSLTSSSAVSFADLSGLHETLENGGRSDNFDPNNNSGNANDGRRDSEGIRLSNDGLRVYVSDEYGPYVYELTASSACACVPSDFPRTCSSAR